MGVPTRRILDPMFGEASLAAANNADATWVRGVISPYDQKGATGWLANLYGGVQTGDDWARVNIPVGELRLQDFNSVQWSYFFTNAEVYGVNIVIWVHDPKDDDKRAEITQAPSGVTLEKASGWNAHELNTATTQFFYYGENVSGSGLSSGSTNQYKWSEFQTDVVFKTWRIYRITLEYGWYSTGTFDDAWVADIKLNGLVIRMRPDRGGSGRVGRRFTTGSGAIAHVLTPKTPFKLLSATLHLSAAATQQDFTVKVDAGRADVYDTVLLTQAMSGITDVVQIWEGGLALKADDEVDTAWTNGDTRTFGLTMTYQTVF